MGQKNMETETQESEMTHCGGKERETQEEEIVRVALERRRTRKHKSMYRDLEAIWIPTKFLNES